MQLTGLNSVAGGRFSKVVVKLYGYVGMNPGVQLVTELNDMHMDSTMPVYRY